MKTQLAIVATRILGLLVVTGWASLSNAITWHESTSRMDASVSGGLPLTDTTDSFFEHNVYEDSALHFPQYTNYLGDGRSFLANYLWLNPEYAGFPHIRHIAASISWIYRNDINGDNQEPRDTTSHRFQLSSRTEVVFTWNGGELVGIVGTDPWTIWHEHRLEKGTYLGGVFIPSGIVIDLPLNISSQIVGAGTYRFVVDLSYDQTDNANWYRGMGANITLHEVATPPNQPPVATDDFYGVDQLGTLVESVPGVLVNDTDPDNDGLTVELLTGPSHASAFNQNANGSFTYTPVATFFGTDTYTYRVFDGTAYSEPATVEITVRQPGAQGFITGGGKFFQDGNKCTFGFVAKVQGSGVQGNLEFQDHGIGLNVKSDSVGWVYTPNLVDGYFTGTCTVNGLPGYSYFVQVHDRGEPGRNDDFSVWVYDAGGAQVYASSGMLESGGNIQIHGR